MNFDLKTLENNPHLLNARRAGNGNTVFLEIIDKNQEKLLKQILDSQIINLCLRDKNNSKQNALLYSIENKKVAGFNILYNYLEQKKPEILSELINECNSSNQHLLLSVMKNMYYFSENKSMLDIFQTMIEYTEEISIKNFNHPKYGTLLHYFFYQFRPNGNSLYNSNNTSLLNQTNKIFEAFLKKGSNPNQPYLSKNNYAKDLMITDAFFAKRLDIVELLLHYPIDMEYKNAYKKNVIEAISDSDVNYALKIQSLYEKNKIENELNVLDTKTKKIKL